jgi:predicted metal-dependent hydrolase
MKIFDYTLRRHPRAKSLKILIRADGGVTVTAPKRLSQRVIQEFVAQRQDWIEATQTRLRSTPKQSVIQGTLAEYQQYKVAALRLAEERLQYFNAEYGFTIRQIVIRNPKGRWGSCSSNGRLMFSYKIVLLQPALADYIIVHELCHLGEMNHSTRFWSLVARTISNYRNICQDLKRS